MIDDFSANHRGIASSLGYENISKYRYWDESSRSLNITGMLEDIQVFIFYLSFEIFFKRYQNI